MKKTLCIMLLFFLAGKTQAQQWSSTALSEPKAMIDAKGIGNKIYFYSGFSWIGNSLIMSEKLEIFDVTTNERQIVTLTDSAIRTGVCITSLNGKVFFAGGMQFHYIAPTTTFNKRIDIYDTLTGTWTQTMLSEGRAYTAGAAVNNTIIFGAGAGKVPASGGFSRTIDFYDFAHPESPYSSIEFPQVSNVSTYRSNMTAVSIGKKIMLAGGDLQTNFIWPVVYTYDTETKDWLPYTMLRQKKTGLKSFVYQNKAYFVGGNTGGTSGGYPYPVLPADTIDIYDNATDQWTVMKIPYFFKKARTGVVRSYSQVVQAGCKMFLLAQTDRSGSNHPQPGTNSPDTVVVYDFARNTWSYLPLPRPRMAVTMAAAKNKVFFAGGVNETFDDDNIYRDYIDILTLFPILQTSIAQTPTTNYTFPTTLLGEHNNVQIDLSNEGDYELLFADMKISITGPDANDFAADITQLTNTLDPTQIKSIPVIFSPLSAGYKTAVLTIYSNDPQHPAYTFILNATVSEELITGTEQSNDRQNFLAYPNPVQEVLKLQINIPFSNATVKLRALNGKMLREFSTSAAQNEWDLRELISGMYLLEVNIDGYISMKKMTVNH